MKTIEINVNEFEKGFREEKLFIETDWLREYIDAELSWFTEQELLEGYKTKFVGTLTEEVQNGFYEKTFYSANLEKWNIENDVIYFETFIEE